MGQESSSVIVAEGVKGAEGEDVATLKHTDASEEVDDESGNAKEGEDGGDQPIAAAINQPPEAGGEHVESATTVGAGEQGGDGSVGASDPGGDGSAVSEANPGGDGSLVTTADPGGDAPDASAT